MFALLAVLLLTTWAAGEQRPWLNSSLPTEKRLQLFLDQLNITQKLSMVQGSQQLETDACIGFIPGIEELGIPAVCMGDGPEGVGNDLSNVTAFPAPVLIIATWNESIVNQFGQALGQEHKAKGRNVVVAPTINIVRSPLWGRAAESLSEDPYLNSIIGVAIIQGIQSQEMVACPKHFAAYNQETNRFGLAPEFDAINALVDERTMHEIYLPAFKAAVQKGHAGSVMCSYNKLNGVHTCEDSWLYSVLKDNWGFEGFVVTDWYFAQRTTIAAALAGLDNSQPGGSWVDYYGFEDFWGEPLARAVENRSVPAARINDMVARLWRPIFSTGVIDRPTTGTEITMARTIRHLELAAQLVEEGAVLLQNHHQVLPLSGSKYQSVAVFGADAADKVIVTELHGGFVLDTTMVVQQPLSYLKRRAAQDNISVQYMEAYPGTEAFDTVPSVMFGHTGLKLTYWKTTDWSGPVNQTLKADNITLEAYPAELGSVWPEVFSYRYEGRFYPNETGLYYFSLYGNGEATLYVNKSLIVSLSGSNFNMVTQGVVRLTRGTAISLRLDYSMGMSVDTGSYGVSLGMNIIPDLHYESVTAAAEATDVSIVFVNDEHTEGLDSNLALQLPGDQDEFISQVARHSRRTIVMLNTNSAILMPWIDEVDAVIEAFYPGQQVGSALARLLFGDVNFSGKLPISFPRAFNDTPTAIPERFPGVNLQANYSEGLYVGYRWFDAQAIEPLFPFGHGLSYTNFKLDELSVDISKTTLGGVLVEISVHVKNTGPLHGQEVIQLYVEFPDECDEPPRLLKGFKKVAISSGQMTLVEFTLDREDLSAWIAKYGGWTFVPGPYSFFVGSSSRDLPLKKTVTLL